MTQRIVLISADFGAGHLQAARAIAHACSEEEPQAESVVLNVGGWGLRQIAAGYLFLLRHAPGLYRRLYKAPVGRVTRFAIQSLFASALRRAIRRWQPDAVVATHPFAAAAAAKLRRSGGLNAPLVSVVTDFLPHPLWAEEGIDRCHAPSRQAATTLLALGVDAERVRVTGIPIDPGFSLPLSRGDLRRVLVMGGGLGLGPIVEAVRSLAVVNERDLRVTVVCGTNEALRAELLDLFGDDARMMILGYSDQIPTLMARADLLISKPGGLTCSEALACKLPILLLPALPGHEEENARFLTESGAARSVPAERMGALVEELLFTAPERLASLRENARLAGRPDAAQRIARETLQLAVAHQGQQAAPPLHKPSLQSQPVLHETSL